MCRSLPPPAKASGTTFSGERDGYVGELVRLSGISVYVVVWKVIEEPRIQGLRLIQSAGNKCEFGVESRSDGRRSRNDEDADEACDQAVLDGSCSRWITEKTTNHRVHDEPSKPVIRLWSAWLKTSYHA